MGLLAWVWKRKLRSDMASIYDASPYASEQAAD
jgi:hypothetical protein